MKRKFLKGLNIEALTDEIIEKIMEENGKDIENQKTQTETLKNQYADIETKLKAFDGVNVDDLKSQVAKLSDEITANKSAFEAEKSNLAFDSWKKEQLAATGAKNTKAYGALFDWDALKSSNNRDADFKTIHEKLKTENSFMFETNNPNHEANKEIPPAGQGSPFTGNTKTITELMAEANANPNRMNEILAIIDTMKKSNTNQTNKT